MNLNKVLVFDVSSEYAHFRKFNTTSSPLTYNLPPRPAVAGLLGAILGVERETSPDVYSHGVIPVNELFHPERCAVAVQILNKIKKTQMAFNLLMTTKQNSSFFNIKNRTQVEYELLKDVKFRIYLHHTDENIMNELIERIQNKRHHFTPYLGLAQLTANVTFAGLHSCVKKSNDGKFVKIHSALNLEKADADNPVKFNEKGFYSVDTFPDVMLRNREVTKYSEILAERTGQDVAEGEKELWLDVNCPEYYCVNENTNIVFL